MSRGQRDALIALGDQLLILGTEESPEEVAARYQADLDELRR